MVQTTEQEAIADRHMRIINLSLTLTRAMASKEGDIMLGITIKATHIITILGTITTRKIMVNSNTKPNLDINQNTGAIVVEGTKVEVVT